MHDKKKIAIAILLSVIVFIIVLLGQMMLQQRDAKSPGATPPHPDRIGARSRTHWPGWIFWHNATR